MLGLKLQDFLKPPATDLQLHHAKMQFARYVFCVSMCVQYSNMVGWEIQQ